MVASANRTEQTGGEDSNRSNAELLTRIAKLEQLLEQSIAQQSAAAAASKRTADRQQRETDDATAIAREIRAAVSRPSANAVLVLTLGATMLTGMAIGAKLAYDGYQAIMAAIPGNQPGEVRQNKRDPAAVDRPEVMAFLDTIAWAEGTGDAYDIQYTFSKFSGYGDHPREIKCSAGLCSDAAGRYQFLSTTWDSQAKALNLPDFSPRSQDLGAIQLLKANGSYDLILSGDIEGAVNAVRTIWASFPGAGHNQPEKSMADVLRVYNEKLQQRKTTASTPASVGKTVKFVGVTVTSARDASGEPGLDYVVSDGQRGAEFGALVAGTVIKTSFEDWESHLENGDTRRGYGSYVIVRVQDGLGDEIDMLYAHMDSIAVKEGDRVQVGTVIGTQGRKGSTYGGAHVSVDFYGADKLTASPASLAMRDRIAYALANELDSLNSQVANPAVAVVKVPEANSQGVPASFVSVKFSTGLCSGFAVAPDRIATALHCISDPAKVTVIDQSGQWLAGQMIANKEDAAIVSIPGANFTPAKLAANPPTIGDALVTWGHPHGGQEIKSVSLTVAGVDNYLVRASGSGVVGGFSGGQVLNAQGEVVGFNSRAKNDSVVLQSIQLVKEIQ